MKAIGRPQRGAALLMAMLIVSLVATFAAAALWQQWRAVEVESAERTRAQASWLLTGALDWARLILREDARSGGPDHLGEPWALPLQESRLSSFLAADAQGVADADEVFLSGVITDMQSRLNVTNLVEGGQISPGALRSFGRLFAALGLQQRELDALAENLRFALDSSAANRSSPMAPLPPQRLPQLIQLGLSRQSLRLLAPYITVLPTRTPVNINTAGPEVLRAVLVGVDASVTQRLLAQRQLTPFRSIAEAAQFLGGSAARLDEAQLAIASRYFEVRGRVRMQGRTVEEVSLVQRDALEVTTLWREKAQPGSPDTP